MIYVQSEERHRIGRFADDAAAGMRKDVPLVPAASIAGRALVTVVAIMTFLAALRRDRVAAPGLLDGPIKGALVQISVEQVRVATLASGDVVIIDNLGSHKGAAIRAMVRKTGARLLFLPPYSPDLNPIEQVFAKLKHFMRNASERTLEATWKRVGAILPTFSAQECANYLKNSGYASV